MSIQDKAMLVKLSISIPTGRKKDKIATSEATKSRNAQDGAYSTSKCMFVKEDIKPIQDLSTEMRTYFKDNTIPWSDKSDRLLPAKKYLEFMKRMDDYKDKMDELKADFIAKYPQIIQNSASFLGDGFDQDEMPTYQQLDQTFKIDLEINKLTDPNDFRYKLSDYEAQQLTDHVKKQEQIKQQQAINNLWTKLYEPVAHLADRLKDSDAKRYHASLISNIMKIADALPTLNIFGDDNLNEMAAEVKEKLADIDIKDIRKSEDTKKDTLSNAQEIIDKMSGFMNVTDNLMFSSDTDESDESDESEEEPEYQEAA
jgi:hypothetical protein